MSIQNKILGTILGLILFFGTLASLTTFILTRNQFIKHLSDTLANSALSQSQEVYQILRQSQSIATTIANRPLVKSYFANPTNQSAKNLLENNYLDGYNLGGMYSAIYLLDATGSAQVSTDPRFLGQNYSFRDYFLKAIKGDLAFYIAKGVTSDELGYYFSAPIYSATDDKKIVGVSVVKLIPAFVETAVVEHAKPGYNTLLTDDLGIVIVSSDPDKLFHSLGTLSDRAIEQLTQNKTYGTITFEQLDYNFLLPALSSTDSAPKIFSKFMDKQDNEEEVIGLVKIPDFPIFFIVEGGLEEIIQDSLKTSSAIAGFVALTAVLSTIIITFFVKILLRKQQESEKNLKARTDDLERLNGLMVGRELKMIELKKSLENKEQS